MNLAKIAVAVVSATKGCFSPWNVISRFSGMPVVVFATSSWAGTALPAPKLHPMGLLPPNPSIVEQLPRTSLRRGFVPLDHVDLSSALPPPGNQGDYGTCAAWAAVYGGASYYARRQLRDPRVTLSPSYVFNQVPHDESNCQGSNLEDMLLFMMKKGAPKLEDYSEQQFCSSDEAALHAAKTAFRIQGAERLAVAPYDENGKRKVEIPVDIDVIRQTLADGDPVVAGFRVNATVLSDLKAGEIYSDRATDESKEKPGRHAMLVVGFDNQKQAFRIMNSWGTNWGDGGYGWISYDSAKSEIEVAYSIEGEQGSSPSPKREDLDDPDAKTSCAHLDAQQTSHGVRLTGFVENEAQLERLVAGLPDLEKKAGAHVEIGQVDIRPWPQCEALLTLLKPLTADDRPALRTLDGLTHLKIGNRFGFELTSPNYPSFLYLIYLQADGQAVNLLPKKGPVREQVAPRTVLRVGDPSVQGPKFKAAEPPGREAVIAIAARSPIAPLEDLEQSGGGYFKAGFDNKDSEGHDAEDRRVLSALNDGLQSQPVLPGKAREIGAAIVFMNIER